MSIILTILISGAVFVLRMFATKPSNGGKTDWIAVVIATISYFLYAISIHAFGDFGNPGTLSTVMGVIVGLWTLLVPLFPTKSLAAVPPCRDAVGRNRAPLPTPGRT